MFKFPWNYVLIKKNANKFISRSGLNTSFCKVCNVTSLPPRINNRSEIWTMQNDIFFFKPFTTEKLVQMTAEAVEICVLSKSYYQLRIFCNLNDWEERYFSLILNAYMWNTVSCSWVAKIWRKDFQSLKIERFKNEKKIHRTNKLRKVHRPGTMSGPVGLKTRTLKPIC